MSESDKRITAQLVQVPDDQLDGLLDWADDGMAPEGPPDMLLAWMLLQPDRKTMSNDVEQMRLEVRTAMRLLELIRYDPNLATVGIAPRRLMELEAKAKLMALEDTDQPLHL